MALSLRHNPGLFSDSHIIHLQMSILRAVLDLIKMFLICVPPFSTILILNFLSLTLLSILVFSSELGVAGIKMMLSSPFVLNHCSCLSLFFFILNSLFHSLFL